MKKFRREENDGDVRSTECWCTFKLIYHLFAFDVPQLECAFITAKKDLVEVCGWMHHARRREVFLELNLSIEGIVDILGSREVPDLETIVFAHREQVITKHEQNINLCVVARKRSPLVINKRKRREERLERERRENKSRGKDMMEFYQFGSFPHKNCSPC